MLAWFPEMNPPRAAASSSSVAASARRDPLEHDEFVASPGGEGVQRAFTPQALDCAPSGIGQCNTVVRPRLIEAIEWAGKHAPVNRPWRPAETTLPALIWRCVLAAIASFAPVAPAPGPCYRGRACDPPVALVAGCAHGPQLCRADRLRLLAAAPSAGGCRGLNVAATSSVLAIQQRRAG